MHRNQHWQAQLAIILLVASVNGIGQHPVSSGEFDVQKARGTITHVTTLADPMQSYWVYLPTHYSADRVWPILYSFDPFARGKTAVEEYQAAAEKYGYIVAGSNNSRNGPTGLEMAAAQALWLDTHRRFAINGRRTYTTGLSGGARLATAIALYCTNCAVAGVIAQGAGYPLTQQGQASIQGSFLYYVAIADSDFNYPEIMTLRRKKAEEGIPCKVKVYPGLHNWAPPEIAEDAIAWLELKAMQAGTEKVDAAFVGKVFEQMKAEAAQAEQRGDALTEYYVLQSLVEDYRGLEDVSAFVTKLSLLKGSKALKNAEHSQQRDIEKQTSLTEVTVGELAQLGAADFEKRDELAQHIVGAMLNLRKHAISPGGDHVVYARAYWQLLIQGQESGLNAFRENQLAPAEAYFRAMAQAAPDQVWPMLFLAEVQVRSGERKAALKAIREAVQRGLKRASSLTQDPELQPLTSDPEFQRIVKVLNAMEAQGENGFRTKKDR